jgi:hypothetical protein
MINLNSLSLPGKEYQKETLPTIYEQILRDNGIRTQSQLSTLREQVIQHLMEMQDAIICQNTADVFLDCFFIDCHDFLLLRYRSYTTLLRIPDIFVQLQLQPGFRKMVVYYVLYDVFGVNFPENGT